VNTNEIIYLLQNYKDLVSDKIHHLNGFDGDDIDYFIRKYSKEYVRITKCLADIRGEFENQYWQNPKTSVV